MSFLVNRITSMAWDQPDHTALECGDRALSYSELARDLHRVTHGLRQLPLQPGDRVAILCTKTIESVIAIYAAMAAGYCAVPINPVLKTQQILHILQDSGANALFIDSARFSRIATEIHAAVKLQAVVLLDDGTHLPNLTLPVRIISWAQFIPAVRTVPPYKAPHSDQQLACLLYTSGSTGTPKGVMVSHRNLFLGAQSVCTFLHSSKQDRILALLPFSFDYGLNQLSHAFFCGATIVLYDYLFPKDLFSTLHRCNITGLAGIPTLWHALTQAGLHKNPTPSLRYITSSGGMLTAKMIKSLMGTFPDTEIFSMYGTTESFRSTCLLPTHLGAKPTSIGKAVPHAELYVLNRNDQLCKPGEIGQLVHAGPLVTLGYWPAGTTGQPQFRCLPPHLRSTFGPQCPAYWTGDLGYIDAEGFLYFVGREDDMIKKSGYRISPQEIEAIATQVEGVEDAIAFGRPDDHRGQQIVLILKSNLNAKTIVKNTIDWFQSAAPHYMKPDAIQVYSTLPMTANGKPDRVQIRQTHQSTQATA